MTSGGNNFNDFPANQRNKFRACKDSKHSRINTCPNLYTGFHV